MNIAKMSMISIKRQKTIIQHLSSDMNIQHCSQETLYLAT